MTDQSPIREQLLNAIDATFCQSLGYSTPEGLLAAYEASRTQTVDQTALRDRIAALFRHRPDEERLGDATPGEIADAVLAVLPATTNHDTDRSDAPPLDPNYSHEACGFHWHGRDGMDIPMRDGQPVCPRCELAKVQKKLDHTQKMRDEVGVECKRRGKRVLEQSERVIALERQVDELQRQLGAEILRAGQAEAELRRVADETAATETQAPHRPVALATPCANLPADCTHPYNWHASTGDCQADGCPCRVFVAGERPEPVDPRRILGIDPDFAAGARQAETVAVPCVECGHPKTDHGEGEDPVTPGQCRTCPDDDARHDYRAAAGARQDGAQQSVSSCSHGPERHGPEAGCIECRCTSTTGHATEQQDGAQR